MDKFKLKNIWIKKIGIMVGIYVSIIIFIIFYILFPNSKKLKDLKEEEKRITSLQQTIELAKNVDEDVKKFISELQNSLVSGEGINDFFFQKIDEISKKVDVKIKNISTSEEFNGEEKFLQKVYNISFSANFQKIGKFVLSLEQEPSFIVKGISISSGKDIPSHEVMIIVGIYLKG